MSLCNSDSKDTHTHDITYKYPVSTISTYLTEATHYVSQLIVLQIDMRDSMISELISLKTFYSYAKINNITYDVNDENEIQFMIDQLLLFTKYDSFRFSMLAEKQNELREYYYKIQHLFPIHFIPKSPPYESELHTLMKTHTRFIDHTLYFNSKIQQVKDIKDDLIISLIKICKLLPSQPYIMFEHTLLKEIIHLNSQLLSLLASSHLNFDELFVVHHKLVNVYCYHVTF